MDRENLRKVEYTVFDKVFNMQTRIREKIIKERGNGYFHTFSQDYEEFESGPGILPVAIIEKENGIVISIPINTSTEIKFVT